MSQSKEGEEGEKGEEGEGEEGDQKAEEKAQEAKADAGGKVGVEETKMGTEREKEDQASEARCSKDRA